MSRRESRCNYCDLREGAGYTGGAQTWGDLLAERAAELLGMARNQAKMMLISGFVDRYLSLNSQEQTEFDASIKALALEETEQVMEIVTSWMEEGLRRGRREGQVETAVDDLIEILEARFKKIPAGLKRTLRAVDDRRQLRLLLRQAATVPTLKDFQQQLTKSS